MPYEQTGNKKVDAIYELIEEEAVVTAQFHRAQAEKLAELAPAKSTGAVATGGSEIADRGFAVL